MRRAVRGGDVDAPGSGEAAAAADRRDRVLLEEVLDALGVGEDDLVFVFVEGGEVELGVRDGDAEGGGGARAVQHFRGLQQRLGGDATDVQAGAAGERVFLDHGGLEAQLGGADGSDVATGPAADDGEVEGVGHGSVPL